MRLVFIPILGVQLACAGAGPPRTPPAESAVPPTPQMPADSGATSQTPVNPAGSAGAVFLERVKAYQDLRGKADEGIPKLTETSDPKKIADRERALGEALVNARTTAKSGDVFAPEFQVVLARTIKDDFAKRTAAERKALIVELPKGVKVGVNQIYPTTIPLATFPANLLKALPDLPPDLEYRIVFRNIILRDVKANYVVDMVTDVFPIPM